MELFLSDNLKIEFLTLEIAYKYMIKKALKQPILGEIA